MNIKKFIKDLFKVKLILIFTTGQIFSLQMANAQKLFYRPVDMSEIEYEAKKMADPDAISYDEYQLNNLVNTDLKENLTAAYLKAQESHLKSMRASNKEHWLNVISFAHKADWGPTQREMIQTGYLRLADLAANYTETQSLIADCYALDDQLTLTPNIYSRRTTELYKEIQKATHKIKIDTKNFSGFSYLLMNGKIYKLTSGEPIYIAAGQKRITLLSPTFKPVTQLMAAENINDFIPDKEIADFEIQKADTISAAQDLKQRKLSDSHQPTEKSNSTFKDRPSIEDKWSSEQQKPIYQKPWFWLSATALATAVLIYQNNKNVDEPHTPTHRSGL